MDLCTKTVKPQSKMNQVFQAFLLVSSTERANMKFQKIIKFVIM